MNIYSLPAVIALTINLTMAFLVLLDKPQKSLNRWFAGFVFLFALWNVSEIIILNSAQYEKALFGAQILYRVLFLIPAFFLIIAYLFPRPTPGFVRKPSFQALILAFPILILAISFPDFKIILLPLKALKNVYYYQIRITLNPPFILLLLVALSYMGWGTIVLIEKLKRARTVRESNQIRFLLIGVVSIFTTYILLNAFHTYLVKMFSFYFFSTLLTLFISFFFFSAIMQFKIFKLSKLITGGLTYTLLSSVVLAIYFLLVRGLSESLSSFFRIDSFLVEATLIFLLIILIHPLEARVERVIDRLLYRDIYAYRRQMVNFSRELVPYFDRDTLFRKIVHFLRENFAIQKVWVFLKNNATGRYELWNRRGKPVQIEENHPLIHRLFRARSGVEYFELPDRYFSAQLRDFFEKNNTTLFLPLISESELLGFFALSHKHNKKSYSQEEIEILSIFANEMAITYTRNLAIDRVREEERLQSRIQRLAAIGQLTAGVAHEIRNPLNTIATAAETLLKRKLDDTSRQELQSYILEEANRLNNILTDFLKLSRIRPPQYRAISIQELLEKIEFDLQGRLDGSITLKIENKLQQKSVKTDPDLLQQVLLNLCFNAIDAIREKQKANSASQGVLSLRAAQLRDGLRFEVEDNGAGISPENRDNIFNPFFTTKAEGTGLGLSISYNIVQTLGGTVEFESSEKGTVFRITLPEPDTKHQLSEEAHGKSGT